MKSLEFKPEEIKTAINRTLITLESRATETEVVKVLKEFQRAWNCEEAREFRRSYYLALQGNWAGESQEKRKARQMLIDIYRKFEEGANLVNYMARFEMINPESLSCALRSVGAYYPIILAHKKALDEKRESDVTDSKL